MVLDEVVCALVERVREEGVGWGDGQCSPHPSRLTREQRARERGSWSPLHCVTKSATQRQNPVNGNEGFVVR